MGLPPSAASRIAARGLIKIPPISNSRKVRRAVSDRVRSDAPQTLVLTCPVSIVLCRLQAASPSGTRSSLSSRRTPFCLSRLRSRQRPRPLRRMPLSRPRQLRDQSYFFLLENGGGRRETEPEWGQHARSGDVLCKCSREGKGRRKKYDWSRRRGGRLRSMGRSGRGRGRLRRRDRQEGIRRELRLLRVPLGDAARNLR